MSWRMRPTPLSSRGENSLAAPLMRRARSGGFCVSGAVMTSPHRGRGAGGPVGRRGVQAERLQLATDGIRFRALQRNVQRLHLQQLFGEGLDAVGTGEMRIFGAQHVDGVLGLVDLMAELHDLLGFEDGLVFDVVDIDRRADQRGDGDEMKQPPHQRASGMKLAASAAKAGASRRSAKRSLAERARGLAAISPCPGTTGWPGKLLKLGRGGAGSPGNKREATRPRPLRRARNCLTMRSSSEWNVTTASRPPGFSARSAAQSALCNCPSSSLTAMRSAWNTRVAGCVRSPGGAGATRATRPASCEVETNGASVRSATMARAMRRAARSSP